VNLTPHTVNLARTDLAPNIQMNTQTNPKILCRNSSPPPPPGPPQCRGYIKPGHGDEVRQLREESNPSVIQLTFTTPQSTSPCSLKPQSARTRSPRDHHEKNQKITTAITTTSPPRSGQGHHEITTITPRDHQAQPIFLPKSSSLVPLERSRQKSQVDGEEIRFRVLDVRIP
jgi:hypothetical protein